MSTVRIEYDDDALNIIEMVNKAMHKEGINYSFVDDNLAHDGYIILELKETKESNG